MLAHSITWSSVAAKVCISCENGVNCDIMEELTWVDGHLIIWHRETGLQIDHDDAHAPDSCNAVAWNQRDDTFATGGDDHIIKM